MGLCPSNLSPEEKAQRVRSRQLEKDLKRARDVDASEVKLLLLGAGESGKSTIFKQMKIIHQKPYSVEEARTFIPVVHNNTVSSMKSLLAQVPVLGQPLLPENQPSAGLIEAMSVDTPISPDLAQHFKRLWQDPGVKATYDKRSKFQLPDSASYYFNMVDTMAAPDYLPSEQDILRSRVRTTGIVETAFEIGNITFKMFDVGGQRNERKKWIHCFENVTAVIFVAALSEYDQVLFEDETQNRMMEALHLFEGICNSRWFLETAMILFLNKSDLFEDKIKLVDLNVCFPDYTGGRNYDAAKEYVQMQFESRVRGDKAIYTHVTCATDKNNVKHVFDAAKDIILKKNLERSGLYA